MARRGRRKTNTEWPLLLFEGERMQPINVPIESLFSLNVGIYVLSEITGDGRFLSIAMLREWAAGNLIPNFLTDFNGWWLAKSIQLRMVSTKIYMIDFDKIQRQMEKEILSP